MDDAAGPSPRRGRRQLAPRPAALHRLGVRLLGGLRLHLWVIAVLLGAPPLLSLPVCVGGFALATVAGSLAFVLPDGWGARELVLLAPSVRSCRSPRPPPPSSPAGSSACSARSPPPAPPSPGPAPPDPCPPPDPRSGKEPHDLRRNPLITVDDCERLSTSQVHELYRAHVNKSQVSLMTSFGFGRELVDHAEGSWIHTRDGRRILDFTGGVGVLNHGHNHPRILAARRRFQEQRRMEVHKTYFSPYIAALGHNLARLLPGDLNLSFFPNSGAEAVEGAVKLAYSTTAAAGSRSCTPTSASTASCSAPAASPAAPRTPSPSPASPVSRPSGTATSTPYGRPSPGPATPRGAATSTRSSSSPSRPPP